MGFKKPRMEDAVSQIRLCAAEASSPFNDGWTSMSCKKNLVELKWLIEDLLETCPTFIGEEAWEQERLMELLKRK